MLDPRWLLACHLDEIKTAAGEIDFTLGSSRLRRWKKTPGLARESEFASFLEAGGLSEEEFARLLGWKPTPSESEAGPRWLSEFLKGMTEGNTEAEAADELLREVFRQGDSTAPFLKLIWPLVRWYRTQLVEHVRSTSEEEALAAEKLGNLLLAPLVPHLRRLLHRTLILEVNIARMENRLSGCSPEERLSSFWTDSMTPQHGSRSCWNIRRSRAIAKAGCKTGLNPRLNSWIGSNRIRQFCASRSAISVGWSRSRATSEMRIEEGAPCWSPNSHRGFAWFINRARSRSIMPFRISSIGSIRFPVFSN